MLPPPPASSNSSYAYRPHPSPSLSLGLNNDSNTSVFSSPQSHMAGSSRTPHKRTPSHLRHASYASARSARSARSGRYGYGRGSEEDREDEDEDDGDGDGDGDTINQEDELDELRAEIMGADDARSSGRGLEETLEELGFGAYHWRLLALCGFGWMSDNSALQCIAVILPRVQVHYNLSSKAVGLLSSSTMAGMMVGAIGWGVLSDMLGRSLPFNLTLFLTAIFGVGASYSPNFPILLCWMFLLGSAVGGSMPTDGTLFLENLPHSKQYLLTLLSVFFSLGAVLSSVVSYYFLPGHSCSEYEGCDIAGGANEGWRRVLFVLGLFNLCCAFARWFLFRLQESPRYLVTNGREQEAVVALRAIATYNDYEIDITPADVLFDPSATHAEDMENGRSSPALGPVRDKKDSEVPSPAADSASVVHERSSLPIFQPPIRNSTDESHRSSGSDATRALPGGSNSSGTDRPPTYTVYDSVGLGPAPPPRTRPLRVGSAFYSASHETPLDRGENNFERSFARATLSGEGDGLNGVEDEGEEADGLIPGPESDGRSAQPKTRKRSRGVLGRIKGWAGDWKTQMAKLFVPQWRRTVILMWIIWGSISFAYTMFNVWLPAVLESRAEGEGDEAIRAALKDFVLYSVAGCPGSLLGAWMIQTRLGRRKSLAICTLATGVSTFIFIRVKSDTAVVVSSMFISMAATAMYAVLYGMTPETFGTAIRGTACGTSAALSRLTGVMAPVSAGALLGISPSLPVFVSAAVFTLTAACSLLLPFERISEGGKRGAVMAH